MAILLLSWQSYFDLDGSTQLDMVEYFAGVGRVARLSGLTGYNSAAFDVIQGVPKGEAAEGPRGRSVMDLTSPAGFSPLDLRCLFYVSYLRLALAMALQGKVGKAVTFWAVCCSSWVHMNAGTSKRDYLTPMGYSAHESVSRSNLLVSRPGRSGQVRRPDAPGLFC